MKTLLLLALFVSTVSYAQTLPLCVTDDNTEQKSTEVYPCLMPQTSAITATMDMMMANKKGMAQYFRIGDHGLMFDPFVDQPMRVTVLSKSPTSDYENYVSKVKFELNLQDCRGTDACVGAYLWTVNAYTESDGYTSQTKYTNKFEALRK